MFFWQLIQVDSIRCGFLHRSSYTFCNQATDRSIQSASCLQQHVNAWCMWMGMWFMISKKKKKRHCVTKCLINKIVVNVTFIVILLQWLYCGRLKRSEKKKTLHVRPCLCANNILTTTPVWQMFVFYLSSGHQSKEDVGAWSMGDKNVVNVIGSVCHQQLSEKLRDFQFGKRTLVLEKIK